MKKKNLLLSSIALLVVAIVGFVGATYAWFVSDVAPNIGKIDVEVVSVGKIAMGVKGPGSTGAGARKAGDFVYTLPWAGETATDTALKNANEDNWDGWYQNPNDYSTPKPLDAITPQFDNTDPDAVKGLLFGAVNTPAGATRDDTLLFETEKKGDPLTATDDEVNYIAFDLYFKNMGEPGADQDFKIAFDATPTTGSRFYVDDTYPFGTAGANKTMTAAQKELPKALRVAFVTYNYEEVTPASGDYEYVIDDVQVWQPNTAALNPATGAVRGTDAGHQDNITANEGVYGASDIAAVGYPSTVTRVVELFNIKPSGSAESTYYSQEIVKLTIYIWIEGNDPDCVSAIAGGGFSSLIKFTTAPIVGP